MSVPSPSLWTATLTTPAGTDGPLDGSCTADIVIVGAGYTGLWTAYHLAVHRRDTRILVLEAEGVGFGASGRNGGWCSAVLPMSLPALARRHGPKATVRLQDALITALGDIRGVLDDEGIDCDLAHGGTVTLARTPPQVERLQHHLAEMRSFGYGDEHHRWLTVSEAIDHARATDVRGGVFTPHCLAIHPARLVHGLADACRRRGVIVHDHTRVTAITPTGVSTERGDVGSPIVLRATEAYTARLPGERRTVAPVYSLMIATEPIDESTWQQIGLTDRQTFHDDRRLVIYGQRTADGRIAFGGRGAPYHARSRIDPSFDTDPRVHDALHHTLVGLFPVLADVGITHRWGGPLAIPRDWHASVAFDPTTGRGAAGGFVGDGVATSYVAGRTLADLVLGHDTELTMLPWVGHRSRRWEPEPLRWMAIRGALRLTRSIDAAESRRRTPPVRSRVLDALTGR